jgi:hypothetical protein
MRYRQAGARKPASAEAVSSSSCAEITPEMIAAGEARLDQLLDQGVASAYLAAEVYAAMVAASRVQHKEPASSRN